MALHRRELLRTSATIACATGIAGVATARTTDPGPADRPGDGPVASRRLQVPDYARWIPDPAETASTAPVQAVYSVTTPAAVESPTLGQSPGGDDGEPPADPMLANPAVSGGIAAFSWLELEEFGLAEPVLGPINREGSPELAAVPTDRTLSVGRETTVYLGSFDAAALRDAVDAGEFSESGDGVYVHAAEGTAVTWTGEAVIVGPSVRRVETVAGAGAGDVPRLAETSDDFAWLLESSGAGGLSVVAYSPNETIPSGGSGGSDSGEDYSMFGGSKGFAQSATVVDGTFTDATTTVVYEGSDAVRRDRLESGLGTDAMDRSVEVDGARVTIRATFAVVTPESTDTPTRTPTATETATAEGTTTRTTTKTSDPAETSSATPTDAQTQTAASVETTARGTGTDTDAVDGGAGTDGEDGGADVADTDESDGSGPGMGPLAGLASLAGAGYLLGRRSDEEGSR